MCRSLRVEGRRLMDMGAGDGQFMVSALASGARMVMGCEHPQNHAQQLILLSVLEGMPKVLGGFDFEQSVSKVEFMLQDIDQALACVFLSSIQYKNFDVFDSLLGQLRVMPGFPEGVYSFWVPGDAPGNPDCHSGALCPLPKCQHACSFSMHKLETPRVR